MKPQAQVNGAEPTTTSIITLTTDFGLADGYLGAMKGVILTRAPLARIVDVSHDIGPQDVFEAAFVIDTAWRYFPDGSVHVVVVDPGVGTTRSRLAIVSHGHVFIGPDNGCLSAALDESVRGRRVAGESYHARRITLPHDIIAMVIENDAVVSGEISATFEGRDVFAPAAAFLASGGDIEALGPRVESVIAFLALHAPIEAGRIDGRIIHVDRFGNLITDVLAVDLPASPRLVVAGRTLALARTYETAEGLSAVVGSSGFVEIAQPDGNAAHVLGAGVGDRVVVVT